MKITTVVLATVLAISTSGAFAADGGGAGGGSAGGASGGAAGGASGAAAGTSGGASSASPGVTTGKTPGDFSETGGRSNHGTSGNNPVGQVAPGTSNAPAGNARN
jgi:ELAV like protein 2/3/4